MGILEQDQETTEIIELSKKLENTKLSMDKIKELIFSEEIIGDSVMIELKNMFKMLNISEYELTLLKEKIISQEYERILISIFESASEKHMRKLLFDLEIEPDNKDDYKNILDRLKTTLEEILENKGLSETILNLKIEVGIQIES